MPESQESKNLSLGAPMYPPPGVITSTPNTVVRALTITFPVAPEPPPPINSTVGGPQNTGPKLQLS